MYRDDYLLRMIEQLVDAVARITGLNRRAEHHQALVAADQALGELGVAAELIHTVDPRTLAGMLREPARIRIAAQLLRESARALAGQGDAARARVRSRRALELLLAARALEPAEQDPAELRELEAMALGEP
jgi:hypothetical protein